MIIMNQFTREKKRKDLKEEADKVRKLLEEGKYSFEELRKKTHLSKSSLHKILNEYLKARRVKDWESNKIIYVLNLKPLIKEAIEEFIKEGKNNIPINGLKARISRKYNIHVSREIFDQQLDEFLDEVDGKEYNVMSKDDKSIWIIKLVKDGTMK